MEDSFRNATFNSSRSEVCEYGPRQVMVVSLIDIITFLVGQPVIVKLLHISFTSSRTTDILNGNLALFHSFQYFISIVHLIVLFALPPIQKKILRLLLVYAEMGGPTSLCFICVQRYVAVVHPTSYPLLKKYRYREVCAVTVWLLSVPMAFLSIFTESAVSPHAEKMLTIFPFCLMLFMTIMLVECSICIARVLRTSDPGKDKLHPAKSRAFKTICATSTITLLFYIPVTLLGKVKSVDEYVYDCLVTPVCILLLSAASVVHPLFYLSTQGKLFSCLSQKITQMEK